MVVIFSRGELGFAPLLALLPPHYSAIGTSVQSPAVAGTDANAQGLATALTTLAEHDITGAKTKDSCFLTSVLMLCASHLCETFINRAMLTILAKQAHTHTHPYPSTRIDTYGVDQFTIKPFLLSSSVGYFFFPLLKIGSYS